MRLSFDEWETRDKSFYAKWYKKALCKTLQMCYFCGWHRGENKQAWRFRVRKSWKWNRKLKWRTIPNI